MRTRRHSVTDTCCATCRHRVELIAHLRAENQQLQELVTRALAKTAEYFLTIQRLRAGVTQEPQA